MSRRLIISGGRQPREFVLVGTLVLGRDPMCDISEQDPLLSRRHAEFIENAGQVLVRDLGSRNGILVNGVKTPQAVLRSGDVVQAGHIQLRFQEDGGPSVIEEPVRTAIAEPRTVVVPEPDPHDRATVMAPSTDALDKTSVPQTVRLTIQKFVGPPGNRFRFDMPGQGWRVVAGGATAIALIVHDSGDATMVVERTAADAETEAEGASERFAVSERDVLRNQQPEATGLDAQVATIEGRRLVIVNYSRPGVRGLERVRQYSVVSGPDVYRLTGNATASRFAEFEDVFARMAATFRT